MNTKETLLKRIEYILGNAESALQTSYQSEYQVLKVSYIEMQSFRTSGLSFILELFGNKHPYYESFNKQVTDEYADEIQVGIAIIKNIKKEIENGWLNSMKGIISAEIFNDFLEMAEHLLESGYKDASAVMIGSVLEEHLRQLCLKNEIEISEERNSKTSPVNSERLNNELTKKEVYNKLEQKSITTVLDLRNKAAHGHYSEYDAKQVKVMYDTVLNFILKHNL